MQDRYFIAKRLVVFLFFSLLITHHSSFADKGGVQMKVSSPDFQANEMIPPQFTCQGEDVSPALDIQDVPDGTKSFVLIIDDPDAPMGTWVHWVVYDIALRYRIDQGEVPGTQGINSFRRLDYGGPCPPSGTHRYFFKLYALDIFLDLSEGATKKDVLQAMEGHILGQAEMIGLYKKK